MGEIRTIYDGLDWYYEPTRTVPKTDYHFDNKCDFISVGPIVPNDLVGEKEKLEKMIDALLKMIESQNKVIDHLMKEKDHG